MPVTANAALLEIARPGALDDSGDPGTPVAVWTGRAAGYLKRERISEVRDGVQADVRKDVFIILRATGAPALEAAGPDWEASTVVIEDQRTPTPVARRWSVVAMENRAAGTTVDSIRLELDTETTPA